MNRKDFIQATGLATLGALVFPSFAFRPVDRQLIGLQLWTVRNEMNDDPPGTLKKISKIGYNNLEPYGFDGKFFGIEAKEFRKIVEDLDMRLTSTHTCITLENASEYIDFANIAGLEYMVLPSPCGRPLDTESDCKAFAEEMNSIGELCARSGLSLGYHNHDSEFRKAGEKMLFDHLIEYTDPELVFLQPDFYFFAKMGVDPLPYFEMYPGRFILWHVKDIGENKETTYLGNGNIDFKKIFEFAEKAGMKYFYVEQSDYVKSPLEDIKSSYKYLKERILM